MEPVNPPKGWLEDPRTQEDCETCDKANCNDRGFIPGGDDLPEDVCCSCEKCHGDPINMKWAAEWERYEAMKEGRDGAV